MQNLSSQLANAVLNADFGPSVFSLLLPENRPHAFELFFFDYKLRVPDGLRSSDAHTKCVARAELCELIKDAGAFHNAYGGYIMFGVADSGPDRVVGMNSDFDVSEFSAKFESYTDVAIEFLFSKQNVGGKEVGLLFIPKRRPEADPVTFKKSANQHPVSLKRAFHSNDTYIRWRDSCRPATASNEDWKLLHGERSWGGGPISATPRLHTKVMLPPRDRELIEFIGRNDYLQTLRDWFTDLRSPVRLLTGIGGLGKTSIAYQFCEELIDLDFQYLENLFWFSAKERTYSAVRGAIVETGRVDFSTSQQLYEIILDHLGYRPDWEDDPNSSDYEEAITDSVGVYRTLIVIDDVDSLPLEHQREVLYRLSNCVNRTVDGATQPSRILFTSRTDQSLPPSYIIKIDGFPEEEFSPFIDRVCSAFRIPELGRNDKKLMMDVTSGSPLFASSLLRLVRIGVPLHTAVNQWRGDDGSEVRKFAFGRELAAISNRSARTLYAMCLLGETSIFELGNILDSTDRLVRDSLSELQTCHLFYIGSSSDYDGKIAPPEDVILTRDVLKRHLGTAALPIERACAHARVSEESKGREIGTGISSVLAYWKREDPRNALAVALELEEKFPANGDIKCLLGTAYLKPTVANFRKADSSFSDAKRLGCKRSELLDGWIRAKEELGDWSGLVEITRHVRTPVRLHDRVFDAHVRGLERLIEAALSRKDPRRYKELLKEIISSIDKKISNKGFNPQQSAELRLVLHDYSDRYVDLIDRISTRRSDRLDVFDSCWSVFLYGVGTKKQALLAQSSLELWWFAALERPVFDAVIIDIVKKRLERLEKIRTSWVGVDDEVAGILLASRLRIAHSASETSV